VVVAWFTARCRARSWASKASEIKEKNDQNMEDYRRREMVVEEKSYLQLWRRHQPTLRGQ
jgi:hypothetical protein